MSNFFFFFFDLLFQILTLVKPFLVRFNKKNPETASQETKESLAFRRLLHSTFSTVNNTFCALYSLPVGSTIIVKCSG